MGFRTRVQVHDDPQAGLGRGSERLPIFTLLNLFCGTVCYVSVALSMLFCRYQSACGDLYGPLFYTSCFYYCSSVMS